MAAIMQDVRFGVRVLCKNPGFTAVAVLLLALLVGRLLASMLYEVSAADPLILIAAPLVLAAVLMLACYLPARRAAKISPIVALRYE